MGLIRFHYPQLGYGLAGFRFSVRALTVSLSRARGRGISCDVVRFWTRPTHLTILLLRMARIYRVFEILDLITPARFAFAGRHSRRPLVEVGVDTAVSCPLRLVPPGGLAL